MMRMRLGVLLVCAVVVCGVVVLGGCTGSSAKATAPTTSTSVPARPKGNLGFREVQAEFPWTAAPSTGSTAPGQTPFPGCAKLVGDSRKQGSHQQEVLPARDHKHCYTVGPVLL